MSDFATNFLAALKASTNKSATGQNLLTIFGAGPGGSIKQADFQRLFAEMQLQQPPQSSSTSGFQPSSFNMKRTIFECQLYPSFSNNYAMAKYQASEMLTALDANADGAVTLAEMASYDTKPPTPAPTDPATPAAPSFIAMSLTTVASLAEGVSAASFASNMLKNFDSAGKGYFTAADVQAAFTKDPTLGDPAHAQSIVSELDGNGDGQVTQLDLVAGYQQLDIVSNLLGAFDPDNKGYIDTTAVAGQIGDVSPALAAMLTSWDADKNGQLKSAEILAGVKASALSLPELSAMVGAVNAAVSARSAMAQYDATNKGFITVADLTAAWSASQGAHDPAHAQTAITAWDANGDGQVNQGEMINGQQVTDVTNQLLAQFDPGALGYIDVSAAGAQSMAAAPNLFNLLKSWDGDGDGKLTEQEIMNGLQNSNAKYQLNAKPKGATPTDAAAQAVSTLSEVDTNADGHINLGEFLNYAGSNPALSPDPIATFKAWDSSADGYLTLDEMQAGIETIQQAQSIVAQYDATSKGYFDAADLRSAISAIDPTKSSADIAAQAQQIMAFWDANGDGKVTVQDVILGVKSGGYVGGEQLATPPASA